MDSSKLQSLDPVELQREKPWRSHRGSTDPDPVAGDHVAHGVLQEGLWRGMAGVMFGHVRTQKMWSDWKLGENWRQKLITSYHNFMRNSEKPTRRDIFRPPPPTPPPCIFLSRPALAPYCTRCGSCTWYSSRGLKTGDFPLTRCCFA